MGRTDEPPDLLPGTLDLLVLKTLRRGAMHGYGIAQHLRTTSDEVVEVGESSLTAAGRRHLASERQEFDRLIAAIQKVLATP